MIRVGTSGYNYPEWKGTFYPQALAASAMLPYYAERFDTVEVNYTFYRMPTRRAVEGWAAATPDGFRFTLKAPKRITHVARLRDCQPAVEAFLEAASALGPKLGCFLFQLPPTQKKDLPTLERFAQLLPHGLRAAFEFRHPSWFEPDTLRLLADRNLALCVADSEKLSAPVEVTADYAYFRLRDEGYGPEDIRRWAGVIAERTSRCRDVYVYFKHEESGIGPKLAQQLTDDLRALGV